jgi:hypothetical protein
VRPKASSLVWKKKSLTWLSHKGTCHESSTSCRASWNDDKWVRIPNIKCQKWDGMSQKNVRLLTKIRAQRLFISRTRFFFESLAARATRKSTKRWNKRNAGNWASHFNTTAMNRRKTFSLYLSRI